MGDGEREELKVKFSLGKPKVEQNPMKPMKEEREQARPNTLILIKKVLRWPRKFSRGSRNPEEQNFHCNHFSGKERNPGQLDFVMYVMVNH